MSKIVGVRVPPSAPHPARLAESVQRLRGETLNPVRKSLWRRGQRCEGIEHADVRAARNASDCVDRIVNPCCDRGRTDDDVGESRRLPLSTRAIGQCSRPAMQLQCRRREFARHKDAATSFKPGVEIGRFACRALAPRLGDAVLDLRDRDHRQVKLRRMKIHPFDQAKVARLSTGYPPRSRWCPPDTRRLKLGLTRRRGIAWRQVVRREWRSHQQAAEGGHLR